MSSTERSRRGGRNNAFRPMAALTLAAFLLTMTGCFGSFTLTQAVLDVNRTSGENEFFESLIFWPLIPVYPLVMFIDASVLNVIEFWDPNYTGSSSSVDIEVSDRVPRAIVLPNSRRRGVPSVAPPPSVGWRTLGSQELGPVSGLTD